MFHTSQPSKMYTRHLFYFIVSIPLVRGFTAYCPKTFITHADFKTGTKDTTTTTGRHSGTTRTSTHLSLIDDEILNESRDHSIQDSFNLIVLGDLHLEDDMTKHNEARNDCILAIKNLSLLPTPPPKGHTNSSNSNSNSNSNLSVDRIIEQIKECPAGDLSANQLEMLLEQKRQGDFMNCHLVSLGDLGRKDIRHEPGDAGTTKSFLDAKEFLNGFNLPYDLVTGNHDLEGLDEFDTDESNLEAWMDCFDKSSPYFSKQIGVKTLLVGLSTVRFRNAPYSSHECHADDEQLAWFEKLIRDHPDEDGWRICVFTHAPIMGSNLRVLQNVHIVNGCAWMNHCSDSRSLFIDTVKKSPQIKLWCSGHFHLSHEFPDSLSKVNQCVFMQVGVVGMKSTRDHTRQTRIVQGNRDEFRIYTVNHHVRDGDGSAELRLDATIDIQSGKMTLIEKARTDCDRNVGEKWWSAYIPREEDGCYLESATGKIASRDDMDKKGEFDWLNEENKLGTCNCTLILD